MPATLSQLVPRRLIATDVSLGPEKVRVTFDANAITLAWAKRYDEAESAEELTALLLEVLDGWDVVQPDGTPDPVSAENLLRLPMWAINQMQREMMEASAPSRAEGNASSGQHSTPPSPTPSVEPQPTSPNGPSTSPSPAPSASPSPT